MIEEAMKQEFINNYIATFLASWTAQHYTEYCMREMHNRLEDPPVEDARYLAECAWEKLNEA